MKTMATNGNASLVIGGTGMLAAATRWLSNHHAPTLLVARRARHFASATGGVVPIDLDWTHADFAQRIGEALGRLPPLGKALIWLHDPARHLPSLLPLLPVRNTVIVLGSMDGRPTIPSAASNAITVRLGSVATPRGRRWLSHTEISAGAIAALQDGRSRIIGELAPVG